MDTSDGADNVRSPAAGNGQPHDRVHRSHDRSHRADGFTEDRRCTALRAALVGELRDDGVAGERVLAAMATVPRHLFTPGHTYNAAYDNRPLPIGSGQTISQPLVVAWMAEAAEIRPGDRVLEVGTGSGYGAAVLAELTDEVTTVERIDTLADNARWVLQQVGYDNVQVVSSNGTMGWPGGAPFDAIVVTAASPEIPESLVAQLSDGGRLVIPVGDRFSQQLVRVRRQGAATQTENLGAVAFVPLIGEQGWESA
jgi:protein-L-isoaspartate(D-aspartate) O-methyltransferase